MKGLAESPEEVVKIAKTVAKDPKAAFESATEAILNPNQTLEGAAQSFAETLQQPLEEQGRAMGKSTGVSAITVVAGKGVIRVVEKGLAQVRFLSSTVKVYRVEGLPNTRLALGEGGSVVVIGNEPMLHLNFGSRARAEQWFANKVAAHMPGVQMKAFRVPKEFVEDLRASAVEQKLASKFPDRPLIDDPTKAPDQFGLRGAQVEELREAIIQGTGEIIK